MDVTSEVLGNIGVVSTKLEISRGERKIQFLEGSALKVNQDGVVEIAFNDGTMILLSYPLKISQPFSVIKCEGQTLEFRFKAADYVAPLENSPFDGVDELEIANYRNILCRRCGQKLFDSGRFLSVHSLPSETWTEMASFWFCHGTPQSETDFNAKLFTHTDGKIILTPHGILLAPPLSSPKPYLAKKAQFPNAARALVKTLTGIGCESADPHFCPKCGTALGMALAKDCAAKVLLFKHALLVSSAEKEVFDGKNNIFGAYDGSGVFGAVVGEAVLGDGGVRKVLVRFLPKRGEKERQTGAGGGWEDDSLMLNILSTNSIAEKKHLSAKTQIIKHLVRYHKGLKTTFEVVSSDIKKIIDLTQQNDTKIIETPLFDLQTALNLLNRNAIGNSQFSPKTHKISFLRLLSTFD